MDEDVGVADALDITLAAAASADGWAAVVAEAEATCMGRLLPPRRQRSPLTQVNSSKARHASPASTAESTSTVTTMAIPTTIAATKVAATISTISTADTNKTSRTTAPATPTEGAASAIPPGTPEELPMLRTAGEKASKTYPLQRRMAPSRGSNSRSSNNSPLCISAPRRPKVTSPRRPLPRMPVHLFSPKATFTPQVIRCFAVWRE